MWNGHFSKLVVLCATTCLVSYADEPGRPNSGGKQQAQKAVASAGATTPARETADVRSATPAPLLHQAKKPVGPHMTAAVDAANEQAIRAQVAALIADYNAKNAEAFKGRFLANAQYELDSGEVIKGKEAIQQHFADLFAKSPGVRAHLKDSKIILVSLNMAIEEGTASVAPSPDVAASETHYLAIWTPVDGRWRLASVREMPGYDEAVTAHDHLQGLAWLVGDWVDESSESLVRVSCRWSPDGNFLLQDFTVKNGSTDLHSGTQRIGWDPSQRQVRSWYFDARGGYGGAFWNWTGERWLIRASGMHEDGVPTLR
jgi:uncharacterized protein (TIGR02246 family)